MSISISVPRERKKSIRNWCLGIEVLKKTFHPHAPRVNDEESTKLIRGPTQSERNPPAHLPLPFDYRTDVVLSVCFTGRIWDSVRIKGLRGRPLIIGIAVERHCWSDQVVQRVRFRSRSRCGLLGCILCTSNFNLSRPWFGVLFTSAFARLSRNRRLVP